MPERVSDNKFVQYSVDFPYFGLQNDQRNYVLLTKSEDNQCSKSDITICPAHNVIFGARQITYEFSLYFRPESHHQLCKRKLLLHHQVPTVRRHGALWIYHFPLQQRVTFYCPEFKDSYTRTELLSDTGLIYNATTCRISTIDIQILSELQGITQTELHSPKIYVPEPLPIMADHEIQQLKEIAPTILQELDNISSRASTLRRTLDIDALLQVHHTAQIQQNQLHWYSIVVTSISTIAILGVLYLCLYPDLQRLLCSSPKQNNSTHPTLSTNHNLPQPTSQLNNEKPEQPTLFASYSTPHAD